MTLKRIVVLLNEIISELNMKGDLIGIRMLARHADYMPAHNKALAFYEQRQCGQPEDTDWTDVSVRSDVVGMFSPA